MRKRRIIVGLIVMTLLATSAAGRLNAIDRFFSGTSKVKGKGLTVSAPVVHHVGFWSHQDDVAITDVRVKEREEMRASHPDFLVRWRG